MEVYEILVVAEHEPQFIEMLCRPFMSAGRTKIVTATYQTFEPRLRSPVGPIWSRVRSRVAWACDKAYHEMLRV